jgi:hypothetical protein
MAFPGFNAETSLYKTSIGYRSRGTAIQRAGAVPQLVDPGGTNCLACNKFGWQFCINCFIEPGRCFSWWQPCSPVPR